MHEGTHLKHGHTHRTIQAYTLDHAAGSARHGVVFNCCAVPWCAVLCGGVLCCAQVLLMTLQGPAPQLDDQPGRRHFSKVRLVLMYYLRVAILNVL